MSADDERAVDTTESSAADGTGPLEPTAAAESLVLTYAVPFLGVVLIAVGLPLAIVGGYVVVQDGIGLCGEPTISATPVDEREGPPTTVEELPAAALSTAEQRALEEAIDSPLREAKVDGEMRNRAALLEGAIVEYEGERYYVQITSQNTCLEVAPLLFPIGAIAILIGIVGVLTPPIYRKMAGFEERVGRDRSD
ncbi:hypothetical protein C488_05653 [Natrinema pellirubrum DSM 15624]|uniref:DUF7979 domain-containing protein n=1 Tax=Natrinema pellirubrum (strain DSM 15624 / CIP 106293 / JCM 10476 / NCIMB 786 / 157) TaxID=797303 RepID=L0JNZ3_NATP1|nr:hypothetical protein [Natrinema pellirubrum]AGB32076.1 hypothetical protein Natpe_2251 [Natrinema pellirubrum DSM 15624]ELY78058.1 hypothetical protein C488_05653 [Natrinema pellirubrum DSM 15624]